MSLNKITCLDGSYHIFKIIPLRLSTISYFLKLLNRRFLIILKLLNRLDCRVFFVYLYPLPHQQLCLLMLLSFPILNLPLRQ